MSPSSAPRNTNETPPPKSRRVEPRSPSWISWETCLLSSTTSTRNRRETVLGSRREMRSMTAARASRPGLRHTGNDLLRRFASREVVRRSPGTRRQRCTRTRRSEREGRGGRQGDRARHQAGAAVRRSTMGSEQRRAGGRVGNSLTCWRCHPDLNWGMVVLQTTALPLGYGTEAQTFSTAHAAGKSLAAPASSQ